MGYLAYQLVRQILSIKGIIASRVWCALTSLHHDWMQLPSLVETNSGRSSYSSHQPSLLASWAHQKMQRAQGFGVNRINFVQVSLGLWQSETLRLYIFQMFLVRPEGHHLWPTRLDLRSPPLSHSHAPELLHWPWPLQVMADKPQWNVCKRALGYTTVTTLNSTSAKMSPSHDIVLPRNYGVTRLNRLTDCVVSGDCIARIHRHTQPIPWGYPVNLCTAVAGHTAQLSISSSLWNLRKG